jgi:hypothetical protein
VLVERAVAGLLCGVALWLSTDCVLAQPQYNVGVLPGAGVAGTRDEIARSVLLYGAVRADLLLGRERSSDFGYGPFVDVATLGFTELRAGGGGSALLPVWRGYPVVLSIGGYGRHASGGWEPGLASWVFVGARGHNYHSSYNAALGLSIGYQQGLGETREHAAIVAAHLDGMLLALPAIVGYEWLRH